MSGKSIAFVIEKGGTGKSTIAFNTAWELSKKSKVLLIDLDGQAANLSFFCGIEKDEIYTVLNVLNGEVKLKDAIVNVKDNLDILAADNGITEIGTQSHFDYLSQKYNLKTNADYQLHLINEMQKLTKVAVKSYDYVIFDPNPSPNYLHTLSLCATDYVIIPVLPDVASIVSDEGTAESIEIIRDTGINENVQVLGVLFNRNTERTNLSKQVRPIINDFAKDLDTTIFKSSIRNSVVLAECVGMHMGITDYRPKSPAADDIRSLVREIKRRINNGNSTKSK